MTVLAAIVDCNQNEVVTKANQILPTSLAWDEMLNDEIPSDIYATELMKTQVILLYSKLKSEMHNWVKSVFWRLIRLGLDIFSMPLTHWGRVTHICVSKLTIIG